MGCTKQVEEMTRRMIRIVEEEHLQKTEESPPPPQQLKLSDF
jgi:hypothetical protein